MLAYFYTGPVASITFFFLTLLSVMSLMIIIFIYWNQPALCFGKEPIMYILGFPSLVQ